MASARDFPVSNGGGRDAAGDRSSDLVHLLRCCHIFASAVRDSLELHLLADVGARPLTLSQIHVLKLLSLDRHRQVGQVAEFLGVSAPAPSKNVDKLERMGLLHRTPSRDDRRATFLASSGAGRRVVEEFEARQQDRIATALEDFTAEDMHLLSRLLERASLSLIRQDDGARTSCLRCGTSWDAHCPVGAERGECPYREVHAEKAGSEAEREYRA